MGDNFGWSVSCAGDMNDDGYPDMVLGAHHADPFGDNSGSAVVYSGQNGAQLLALNGRHSGDEFGCDVARLGDVNKDGYADIVVGVHLDDTAGSNSGAAAVYLLGDADGDQWTFSCDNCPGAYNVDQEDSDGDEVGDSCDNCIWAFNPDQADTNNNGIGDVCETTCGDADGGGTVDISDAVYIKSFIFDGGPPPDPFLEADADCNGLVNISDVVYLIAYIFGGGIPPCARC
jgi:hypothetical protein